MKKNTAMTRWSIYRASLEFGVTRETITRALAQSGADIQKGATYPTRQIFLALAGDIKGERLRVVKATADRVERQNQVETGKLIPYTEAQDQARAAGGIILTHLQRLEMELPAHLTGLSAVEIAQYLDTEFRRVRSEMREAFNNVGTSPKK